MRKFLKIVSAVIFVFIIVGILFIKFDTPAAAEFTDNYLRPILGNQFVGFLEKIYFNLSDKAQQLTNKTGSTNIPQFADEGTESYQICGQF